MESDMKVCTIYYLCIYMCNKEYEEIRCQQATSRLHIIISTSKLLD